MRGLRAFATSNDKTKSQEKVRIDGRISSADLAAGIYPLGDVRNNPIVRKAILDASGVDLAADLRALRSSASPGTGAGWYEQAALRRFLDDLHRRSTSAPCAILSRRSRQLLHDLANSIQRDLEQA